MDVQIIDYTGAGHPDPFYAAKLLAYTKNTRLEQSVSSFEGYQKLDEQKLADELVYISKTIRSSWEFVDYVFQITGVSRAFTHQLVRTRSGVSFAQQAQRVVDMSGFEAVLPETIALNDQAASVWQMCMADIKYAYEKLRSFGIAAQDARGVLPTNVCTNIIMKINLRALADLLGKRKNLRAQGEYADVARLMEARVLALHPWTRPFLDPDRLHTPRLDEMLKDALGSASPIDKPKINEALKELDALKGTWG